MTHDDIDAEYRATMRKHRRAVVRAVAALVALAVLGSVAFLLVMRPAQTPGECVADAVAMYVETQEDSGIWTPTERGKAAAADNARAACQRFAR